MPLPFEQQLINAVRTLAASQARLRRIQETVLPRSGERLAATDRALCSSVTREIETWELVERALEI